METLVLGTDRASLDIAASLLKDGGVVAIPTETVYGLAANAFDSEAVKEFLPPKTVRAIILLLSTYQALI